MTATTTANRGINRGKKEIIQHLKNWTPITLQAQSIKDKFVFTGAPVLI